MKDAGIQSEIEWFSSDEEVLTEPELVQTESVGVTVGTQTENEWFSGDEEVQTEPELRIYVL